MNLRYSKHIFAKCILNQKLVEYEKSCCEELIGDIFCRSVNFFL